MVERKFNSGLGQMSLFPVKSVLPYLGRSVSTAVTSTIFQSATSNPICLYTAYVIIAPEKLQDMVRQIDD